MFGVSPLTPAFSRDYPNKKEVEKDFNDNKDFMTSMGQLINKEQIQGLDIGSINIRYQKLTKVAVVKVI